MVAQTLNAHQLPLPEGATGLAPETILVTLPAGAPRERVVTAADFATVPAPGAGVPDWTLPPDACDAHFHVFGPHDRFRPAVTPLYALPEAPPQVAATLRKTLGLTRGVLVQPAPYGSNPDADAERHRGRARHAPRHCGRRSRHRYRHTRGLASRGHRRAPLRRDARTGWQPLSRQCRLRCHRGAGAAHAGGGPSRPAMGQGGCSSPNGCRHLLRSKVLPVLDHMACPDPLHGPNAAAFKSIRARLADRDVWAKLTICRVSQRSPGHDDARAFHDALIAAAPERVVWGSDGPMCGCSPAPDAGQMLDLLRSWAPDPAQRSRILVDNPARLYGFERTAP